MEKLKKIRIDIISLILVLICSYFLGIVGIGISIVFLIIYIKSVENHYFLQKLLLFFSFAGIIISFGGLVLIETMENKGIDGIGEALIYGAMIALGRILLIVCPFITFIIDNRKFIFRKKIIIPIIVLGISITLYFPIRYIITTTRISENIPTVGDFEKELIQRGIMTKKTSYKLYGVSSTNKKAIKLSFEKNNIDKYPLYVYSVSNSSWIIYYANGEIYAVRGKYWDYYTEYDVKSGYNEEKIIWDYPDEILSETEKISVYNAKTNRYEKGNIIADTGFNYYSKNKEAEDSIFIAIPSIESFGTKIKQINRIDRNSLNY